MATLKEVRALARDLDRKDDLVDALDAEITRLQSQLNEKQAARATARADRNAAKDALKAAAATLS